MGLLLNIAGQRLLHPGSIPGITPQSLSWMTTGRIPYLPTNFITIMGTTLLDQPISGHSLKAWKQQVVRMMVLESSPQIHLPMILYL